MMWICLGDSKKVDNEILKLLDILLKDDASVEVKKRKLEEDFQIPMTQEIEQGVKHMCNLSDGIEQRGIKRGIERGRIEPIIKKVQKNKSIEVIADELECTVDDISESYDIVVKYAGVCSVDDVVKELNK